MNVENATSSWHTEKLFDPETGELLHLVWQLAMNQSSTSSYSRVDFSNPSEFLQGAAIFIPSGMEFRPHIHLERERSFSNLRAQECWVVVSGEVEVDYYSERGKFLASRQLIAGSISMSFKGGHGYRAKASDSIVYEFKSGPYEGQEIDKKFI